MKEISPDHRMYRQIIGIRMRFLLLLFHFASGPSGAYCSKFTLCSVHIELFLFDAQVIFFYSLAEKENISTNIINNQNKWLKRSMLEKNINHCQYVYIDPLYEISTQMIIIINRYFLIKIINISNMLKRIDLHDCEEINKHLIFVLHCFNLNKKY